MIPTSILTKKGLGVCLEGLGVIELLQLVGQLFSLAKSCRYKLDRTCCRGGSCSWSSGLCICGFSSACTNDCEVSGTIASVWFTTAANQVRNPSGQILGSRRVNTLLWGSIELVCNRFDAVLGSCDSQVICVINGCLGILLL